MSNAFSRLTVWASTNPIVKYSPPYLWEGWGGSGKVGGYARDLCLPFEVGNMQRKAK